MLRNRISIYTVTAKPDDGTGIDYENTLVAHVWAKIVYPNQIFNPEGFGEDQDAMTRFYIRLRSGINSKQFVQCGNDWYKIATVERKSQNEDFLILSCIPRANNTLSDYSIVDSEGDEISNNDDHESGNKNWEYPYSVT